MFKLRVQKVLLLVSTFFVLGIVVIYQLSYGEAKHGNFRELVSIKDRSLKEPLDLKTIKVDIGFKKKSLFEPWSKSVAVYSEGW